MTKVDEKIASASLDYFAYQNLNLMLDKNHFFNSQQFLKSRSAVLYS